MKFKMTNAASKIRLNKTGAPLQGPPQKTTPLHLNLLDNDKSNVRLAPDIEKQHVHAVYDTIADHWSHTRYRAWPRVAEFLERLDKYACVADLGMGNGKNVIAGLRDCQKNVGFFLGTDISGPLVVGAAAKIESLNFKAERRKAKEEEHEKDNRPRSKDAQEIKHAGAQAAIQGCSSEDDHVESSPQLLDSTADFAVADCVSLPVRDGVFDASICIAVLHHLSTVDRRVAVLRESLRVVKPGGFFLVYAWAQEQEETGCSRHVFETQDVLVKWHHKIPGLKKEDVDREQVLEKMLEKNSQAATGVLDKEKGAIIYQRYCHVYREGELEALFRDHLSDISIVEEVYLDTGNWCVRAKRI